MISLFTQTKRCLVRFLAGVSVSKDETFNFPTTDRLSNMYVFVGGKEDMCAISTCIV